LVTHITVGGNEALVGDLVRCEEMSARSVWGVVLAAGSESRPPSLTGLTPVSMRLCRTVPISVSTNTQHFTILLYTSQFFYYTYICKVEN